MADGEIDLAVGLPTDVLRTAGGIIDASVEAAAVEAAVVRAARERLVRNGGVR